ncbi:hypothetical protein CF75_gp172 [Staphylococcus phage phiSA12]|uniref:Uncharacterized protein n=1 Tax=Staphylococcus phage phiSA12 TaxID=1450142 RepID=W0TXV3_9CAUD|nr:hypothetical protein CF75_gp172 [Staphylococcus phage phiSA12]BAO47219.1 hypothetical protein [Staphylococcus phage phiSA12]
MEKFKGKDLYKTRIRKQTIKNLIIKVEKLHNKHNPYQPIGHVYYYPKTKEFTLSKPEQKIFVEYMKKLGFNVKHKRRKKTLIIYKNAFTEYISMYHEAIEQIEGGT